MGSAQTLLASSSSHQKALDTFLGQKAHPSFSSPPCRGALEGSQTWVEIGGTGWGRGAASSSVVPLGPGWLKCNPNSEYVYSGIAAPWSIWLWEAFEELLASSFSSVNSLVFSEVSRWEEGKGELQEQTAGLACRALGLDSWIVMKL